MNAPHFNFGSEGRDLRLPTTVVGDGRDRKSGAGRTLALAEPAATVEPDGPNRRDQFLKYLGLAVKHRWLILACCAGGLVIGFLVTFTSTPIYRATATIQIDLGAARVVKLDSVQTPEARGEEDSLRFYQTQYDLLKSRSLAEGVASKLDLRDDAEFVNPRPSSSWGKLRRMIFPEKPRDKLDLAQRKAAAAALIQGGLTVAPSLNSSLVKISFDSPDPKWAQTIANAVAQGFADMNLERRYGSSAYARKFLEEKLEELKIKLEESEKALVAYAEKEQIITSKSKDQQPLADSDLISLNTALQQVRAERIRAQEQWDQAAKTKGLVLPQVLNDKSISALREKRAMLGSDYQEKLATFKPDYPDMRRLKALIAQFDAEIELAGNVIKGSLKAQYESLLQQEELLQKNIEEARGKVLTSRNKDIQMQILQREADSTRTLYDGLLQQYKDIGVAGATGANNVAMIDRAELPGAPYKPNLMRNLLTWLFLGLLLAGAAVTGLEILDDTFKAPEDIEDQLGLSVLGLIPKVREDIFQTLRESPVSAICESYRSLRTALQFSTSGGLPKTLVITSSKAGEGKSTTSVALAISLAQLGMKVLLIDADLRKPSAHQLLKRENESGLTNYLVGGVSARDVLQETDVSGLWFMASGPVPPNPAELLAGQNMARLLSTASENFAVVIVDAPPVLGLADAPLLASIAASTILVVGAGEARRGIVKATLKRLYFARAEMVGIVVNKFDMRAAHYAYQSYGYGTEYYGAYGVKALPKTTANQV